MHLSRAIESIAKHTKIQDMLKVSELASIAIKVAHEHRLNIDTQAVLFDPRLGDKREKILKAMDDPLFPPVQASVAIGKKELPEPAYDLEVRLALVGCSSIGAKTVADAVTSKTTYLWVLPSRGLADIDAVHLDTVDMRNGKPFGAQLGMGFCLLSQFDSIGAPPPLEYRALLPVVHYQRQTHAWATSDILSAVIRETARVSRAERPLADFIGAPVESLPRVLVCPSCLVMFTHQTGKAQHCCTAEGPHAVTVIGALRARFDSGNRVFKTIDLVGEVAPRNRADGEEFVPLTADALEAFLQVNRRTLGVRNLDGVWDQLRRPSIDLHADHPQNAPKAAPQDAEA